MLNVANLGGMLVGLPAGQNLDLDKLISDLACGLRPSADVWREHGINDREVAARILSLDVVQEMLKEARAVWHGAGNTKARVKVRSAMAVEHLLVPLVAAAGNPAYPLNHRTDAVKFLAKLGGMDVDGAGGGEGGGGVAVTISIDLTDPTGRERGGLRTVTEVRGKVRGLGHGGMVDVEDDYVEIDAQEGQDDDDDDIFAEAQDGGDALLLSEEDEALLVSLPLDHRDGLPTWAPESGDDDGDDEEAL